MIKKKDACELCGSTRGLEVHHIIPRCVGGSDSEDNIITVCVKCHGILTPKSELTRLGIQRVKARNELIELGLEDGEKKQIGQKAGAKFNVKKAEPAKAIIRKYSKDFEGTLDDVQVMKLAGVARNTYYKYKRELKEGV